MFSGMFGAFLIDILLKTLFYVFGVICICIFATFCYQTWSSFFKKLRNIPGPKSLPIVGDVFNKLTSQDETFKLDRERALEFYPIFKVHFFNLGIVVLILPEDVELILSSTQQLKKSQFYDLTHPWLRTGLLTSTDEKWRTRRKILTPAFHFSILREFVAIFNENTKQLIDDISKRLSEPYIDVIPPITELTLSAITETSMGIELDSNTENSRNYRKAVNDFGRILAHRLVRPWLSFEILFRNTKVGKDFSKTIKTLHDFSTNVIEKKKSQITSSYSSRKRMAMLDLLLNAQANGEYIDDIGIKEEVDTFMFEGHDTTSVALCFILMLLANNPKHQGEIYQEIVDILGKGVAKDPDYNDLQSFNYMERCLKECLRLYPSVPSISRETSADVETKSGYIIPAGAAVCIQIYDIHHSPHLYPDPEKFDPDRFLPENVKSRHPFAYVPFSAGPRNCIGQRYAMLELKAVVCGILRKFKLEPIDTPKDMTFITDMVLRTSNEIRVKFTPRI